MSKSTLVLQPANSTDRPQLTTIFPRAFHPVSPYMLKAIPDTPTIRKWWDEVSITAIEDPEVRLIKVISQSAGNEQIAAIARYRIAARREVSGEIEDCGTWSKVPFTIDHDRTLCDAFMEFMGRARADYMADKRHLFIELVATAHDFKGQGAGRLLVERICADADEEGLECFVETNRDIVGFYERFGFGLREERDMPGGLGYTEFIMVRSPKKRKPEDDENS